jgi:phage-related protein
MPFKKLWKRRALNFGMPYTRAMKDGFFEIRLSEKNSISRVFYCTIEKNEIFVLHSFIKKKNNARS